MDLKRVIATLPWLRKLWLFLPSPLRIPLLLISAVVWLWRRGKGEDPDQGPGQGPGQLGPDQGAPRDPSRTG